MNTDPLVAGPRHLPVVQPAISAGSAVTSCEGCGVCCRTQPLPPFLDDIDFLPIDLQKEVMELQKREAELWELARPCTWWEESTGRCRHHEHRPNICREFEVGEELCLEFREKFGVK